MGIGILAFGSINEVPGPELAAAVTERIAVTTPFSVEFARSSRTRDGAPTLVPVSGGGARIPAWVLVLKGSVDVEDARAMLYRRETGRLNDTAVGAQINWIAELAGFAGIEVCLYTALRANIRPLTAEKLAELALRSAAAQAGIERRDGVSYLKEQKRRGIVTPMMSPYEEAVLARTGARDLDDAWDRVRSGIALKATRRTARFGAAKDGYNGHPECGHRPAGEAISSRPPRFRSPVAGILIVAICGGDGS